MKLYPHGERMFLHIGKSGQRRDNIKIHTDQIKNKGIHYGHAPKDNFPIAAALIERVWNEKQNGNQRGKSINHM